MSRRDFVRHPRMAPRGDVAGFSVLEMLVVIAVIGVMAAVGIPSLLSQLNKVRLEAAASDVANLIRQTRLRAIRDGTQYSVGVAGNTVTGEGVIASVELELDDPSALLYPGSGSAVCQDKYDGTADTWGGETILYESTGTAIDAGGGGTTGTGAICLYDGGENVLQVVLEYSAGQPKIRKFLTAADSPTGAEGFFEKTSAATTGSTWTWY